MIPHLRSQLGRHGGGGSVQLHRNGKIALIEFENKSKMNALSGKMMVELSECVEALASNHGGAVALILKGTKDFFCSGADLSAFKNDFTHQDGLDMSELMQDTLYNMRRLPLISVAAINGGGCIGGGTELSLTCDFRVMHPNAKFRMVHPTLGLTPGWGGGSRLVNIVGRKEAIRILCSSPSLSAEECLDLGIVDALSEDPEQEAEHLLQRYCDMPYPEAVRKNKHVIALAEDSKHMFSSLEKERKIFSTAWGGEDNKDALSKLKSKRK